MSEKRIEVRVTETGTTLDVLVTRKRPERIEVMVGEGAYSVKCALMPTTNCDAYVGDALGREIVYERSCEQVKADLALEPHDSRVSGQR